MLLATLVVSFILTVIGIPAFIRFYQAAIFGPTNARRCEATQSQSRYSYYGGSGLLDHFSLCHPCL